MNSGTTGLLLPDQLRYISLGLLVLRDYIPSRLRKRGVARRTLSLLPDPNPLTLSLPMGIHWVLSEELDLGYVRS